VLNSSILYDPAGVRGDFDSQESWLSAELEKARNSGAKHIVVFQHHPYFLSDINEKDQYYNIPLDRRKKYLEMLRNAGVRYIFAGHTHRNVMAHDGNLEMISSAALSGNMDNAPTGFRIVIVRDGGLEHRFYPFGSVPRKVDVEKSLP
jgi:3',5'-cyclic AMP phosphodiesterase CpdA